MVKNLEVDRSFDAFQEFVLGCKLAWTRELYPALRARYEEKGAAAKNAAEVEALLADDPLNQYFGWFERHLQRMKYSGLHGLAPHFMAERAQLAAELEAGAKSGLVELDPNFVQPDYYVAVDIHQHPGGVWSDEVAG